MKKEKQLKIAIVAQHDLFRKGLTVLLEGIGYPAQSIITATTIEKAFEKDPGIGLVLFHILPMETASAVKIINQFKVQHASVQLLAVLPWFDEELTSQLVEQTTAGYIFADAEPSAFKAAIKQAMQGKRYCGRPTALQFVNQSIN